jgi:hypothetical protein
VRETHWPWGTVQWAAGRGALRWLCCLLALLLVAQPAGWLPRVVSNALVRSEEAPKAAEEAGEGAKLVAPVGHARRSVRFGPPPALSCWKPPSSSPRQLTNPSAGADSFHTRAGTPLRC